MATPRLPSTALLALAGVLLGAAVAHATTPLTTVRIASGLARPVFVASPPGDERLFIVEQRGSDARGRIRIYRNGAVLPTPFLTTAPLATNTEQGLLGLAFDPDFATNGEFYINYTDAGGTTRIARHKVSAGDPDRADSLGTIVLSVAQPFVNHNAGWLAFGPDGYLWVPLGDGGGTGDPGNRAQDLNQLLGKILRLDVRGQATYAIPPDNPYVGTAGLDEIWALGVRNPYRCSFDRETHDLVIGDVGQSAREEVDFAPFAGGLGRGVNYGWRCWEGTLVYNGSGATPCASCATASCFRFPAWEYDHSQGRCAITGGYVYRGCAIPDLRGTYFFADYCGNQVYSGRFADGALGGVVERTAELAVPGFTISAISSFGEDAAGELYICDLGGEVFKIVPAAPVAEADQPVLRVATAAGDTLGSTGYGNALLPGVTAFADAGSRIAGVGFLRDAVARDCVTAGDSCLAAALTLGSWDIDLTACVDADSATLSRTFVFTNRAAGARPLVYRDVIAPWLGGDDDVASTLIPASGDDSPTLVLADAAAPVGYITQRGTAAGAAFSQDVDSSSAVEARVAADFPLLGAAGAGPGRLALALGFDFGAVAAGASRTVTMVTRIYSGNSVAVPPGGGAGARLLHALGPVPFRDRFAFALAVPRDGRATVHVYDARGRIVRRLFDGVLAAGEHGMAWDGADGRGAPVPAGLYFVRAEAAGAGDVLRVIRLR